MEGQLLSAFLFYERIFLLGVYVLTRPIKLLLDIKFLLDNKFLLNIIILHAALSFVLAFKRFQFV